VSQCPKCEYFGVVDLGNRCGEALECGRCGEKWVDSRIAEIEESWFGKMKTDLVNVILSEPCRNCNVLIYKNGGCSNMYCAKCKTTMCWECMQPTLSYSHTHNDLSRTCPLRSLSLHLTTFLASFTLLIKLLFAFPLFDYLCTKFAILLACLLFLYLYFMTFTAYPAIYF
jgi:hypothetical protein